ncbi:MAG: hypothetical protein OHK0015_10860 [Chloroflexi bacterium OHK40]
MYGKAARGLKYGKTLENAHAERGELCSLLPAPIAGNAPDVSQYRRRIERLSRATDKAARFGGLGMLQQTGGSDPHFTRYKAVPACPPTDRPFTHQRDPGARAGRRPCGFDSGRAATDDTYGA